MFVIGIDPHKGSHTAAVVDGTEQLVGELRVSADRRQRERLLRFAAPFAPRSWAVEAASGLGALLAQQLVAAIHALGVSAEDHTLTHPDLRKLEGTALQKEVCGVLDDYTVRFGAWPWLMRPPGGFLSSSVPVVARRCGIRAWFVTWRATMNDGRLDVAIHALGVSAEDHTLTHPDLRTLEGTALQKEICGVLDDYTVRFGARPWLMRPPGGFLSSSVPVVARPCGIRAVVTWRATMNDGRLDVQGGGPLQPGDIILMHFRPDLRQNLEVALDAARAAGLQPAPLEEYLTPA